MKELITLYYIEIFLLRKNQKESLKYLYTNVVLLNEYRV